MEKKAMTEKLKRKRKSLLVMPLLVVPFLTIGFYALGGGHGKKVNAAADKKITGLNLNLPSAELKEDKNATKLTFYEKAEEEEKQRENAMKKDPYFEKQNNGDDIDELERIMQQSSGKYGNSFSKLNTSPVHKNGYTDPAEEKIYKKLDLLQKEINKPQQKTEYISEDYDGEHGNNEQLSSSVDRLENMLSMMNDKKQGDPEMQQLEGMLNKILDIQHPELIKERIKENSVQNKRQVFAVSRIEDNVTVSLLGKSDTSSKPYAAASGFYGSSETSFDNRGNAIEAVVHETKALVNGSVVKLRLLNDIYVNGNLVPKDNFLFGIASLNGERLEIEINSIRCENSLLPVKLQVYDMDGLAGIYIPGAITRDVAKQSADNNLKLMKLTTLNPSFGAQAASAGINAAKNLISKKVKLVKVTVKAGYKVLLKDGNAKDQ